MCGGIAVWPAVIIGGLAVSYYGARALLPEQPPILPCNHNIQGFEMRGVPIYWQVEKGQCGPGDPNFKYVLQDIEVELAEQPTEEWPAAHCETIINGPVPFAYKFGTDYYDLEELDCAGILQDVIEEAEKNFDLLGYIQDAMKEKSRTAGAAQLLKMFGF